MTAGKVHEQFDVGAFLAREFKSVIGRKIIGVTSDPDYDGNQQGAWGFLLDNDTILWIDRDQEANGPGWAAIEAMNGAGE